jgi:hypothetical protein
VACAGKAPETVLKATDQWGGNCRDKLAGPATAGPSGVRIGPFKLLVSDTQFSIRDLDQDQDRGLDFGSLTVPDRALITTGIQPGM